MAGTNFRSHVANEYDPSSSSQTLFEPQPGLPTTKTPATPEPSGRGRSANRSPLNLLRWSFRDKKETIAVVEHFAEVNDQLLGMVRFWSLASSIGVDLRHLEHLRTDQDAVNLGLRDEASLALTVSSAQGFKESFELDGSWDKIMQGGRTIEERFAVFNWNETNLLRESCMYSHVAEPHVDPQTRKRINLLAKLLYQPKEKLFCILPCHGWSFCPRRNQISYFFKIPSGLNLEPKSLLLLLKDHKAQPSLGMKFHIAHSLARSIAQLHMVKWVSAPKIIDIQSVLKCCNMQVHESFRSENILFFTSRIGTDNENAQSEALDKVDLTQPWIFGFEFSRPDSFFSAGFIDACPDRDVYRHPERQGQPLTTFRKIHDIYALGIILLEIGKRNFSLPRMLGFPLPQRMLSDPCVLRDLATCGHPGEKSICTCPRFTGSPSRHHSTFNKACSEASRKPDGLEVQRYRLEVH